MRRFCQIHPPLHPEAEGITNAGDPVGVYSASPCWHELFFIVYYNSSCPLCQDLLERSLWFFKLSRRFQRYYIHSRRLCQISTNRFSIPCRLPGLPHQQARRHLPASRPLGVFPLAEHDGGIYHAPHQLSNPQASFFTSPHAAVWPAARSPHRHIPGHRPPAGRAPAVSPGPPAVPAGAQYTWPSPPPPGWDWWPG